MEVIHDIKNKKFILPLEKKYEAIIEYTLDSCNGMHLIHSEIPLSMRGKGLGKELVLKTFKKLTEEGYEAKAICPYIEHIAMQDKKWSTIIKHKYTKL